MFYPAVPPVLAAALPARPSFVELIEFQINGIIVVTIALGLIWGLLELSGAFFRHRGATAAAITRTPVAELEPTSAVAGFEPPEPTTDAPPPHHVAILGAVVHLTVGPRARIIALSSRPPGPEWAAEGRRAIFAAHKVR